MARIAYGMCNVVTGDDSTSYRRSDNSEPAPQVTIPHLRARLTIQEAKALADELWRLFSFSTTRVWCHEASAVPALARRADGGPVQTRTADLYRVKVAL